MQVTDSATHVRPGEEIDAHAVGIFLKSHVDDLEGEIWKLEMDEDPEKHIYNLNDHILVRERTWNTDNL